MKIAIIGAGACGLMLAANLENTQIEYTIFNDGKVGNKILASGNGRCNLANFDVNDEHYHYNKFAANIVKNYRGILMAKFGELKIYYHSDTEGRVYPYSECSQSVLNAMMRHINKDAIVADTIKTVTVRNEKYFLNNEYGPFDKLVFAFGSPANKKNDPEFLSPLDNLGLSIKKFVPSLTGFRVKENLFPISGVRARCQASLYQDNTLIHSEYGEAIFKEDGISGICIMNMSSYYAHLENQKKCEIRLNLALHDFDDYIAVLNPKLLNYVINNSINVHDMRLTVKGTYGLELSQVAYGGIETKELNDDLSLKKYPDFYAGGELVDADGVCGGYNLMFAFISGIIIANSLKK